MRASIIGDGSIAAQSAQHYVEELNETLKEAVHH